MTDELGGTADEVKPRLKHGDQLFFVDVRHHQDWDWAVLKVRDALRVNDDEVEKHLNQIPRGNTIIVYSSAPATRGAVAWPSCSGNLVGMMPTFLLAASMHIAKKGYRWRI